MRKNQVGATLIIVLLLLVAITLIGSLAIRSSVLSLKVSTMSQAQQLLLQNSDAALFKIEDPAQLMKNMALNGMLLMLVLGLHYSSKNYFEAALLLALLSFVSTMAMAKFLLRGEVIE